MKKIRKTLYKAKHYMINCARNDLVDIRCGGPLFTGYDFYIDADLPKEKVIKWLKMALEKSGKPCIGINTLATINVEKLWTQKDIWGCLHGVEV